MMGKTEMRDHEDEEVERLRVRREVAAKLAVFRRRVAGRGVATVAELLEESRRNRMEHLAGVGTLDDADERR
jgi:hypothetical protein